MAAQRRSEAEYAEMAADYETHPPTTDEVASVEVNPAFLRTGRPRKGVASSGRSAVTPVRLPDAIRDELAMRALAKGSENLSRTILGVRRPPTHFEFPPNSSELPPEQHSPWLRSPAIVRERCCSPLEAHLQMGCSLFRRQHRAGLAVLVFLVARLLQIRGRRVLAACL